MRAEVSSDGLSRPLGCPSLVNRVDPHSRSRRFLHCDDEFVPNRAKIAGQPLPRNQETRGTLTVVWKEHFGRASRLVRWPPPVSPHRRRDSRYCTPDSDRASEVSSPSWSR